jgi:DNA-binding NtrC family response regulator
VSVLVIDDNRGTRNALDLWLARMGFHSILCEDAEEGLRRLGEMVERGDSVEMVFVDQVLPGKSGLEFIQDGKKLLPGLKAVLISGYQEQSLRRKARELHNCRFLAKPFTSEDLRLIFEDLEQLDVS